MHAEDARIGKPERTAGLDEIGPFTAMVGARAMRANGGTEVSAMATMMFSIEGPSIATMISPRMSDGKASSMSMICIVDHVEPPAEPAREHSDQRAGRHRDQGGDDADTSETRAP